MRKGWEGEGRGRKRKEREGGMDDPPHILNWLQACAKDGYLSNQAVLWLGIERATAGSESDVLTTWQPSHHCQRHINSSSCVFLSIKDPSTRPSIASTRHRACVIVLPYASVSLLNGRHLNATHSGLIESRPPCITRRLYKETRCATHSAPCTGVARYTQRYLSMILRDDTSMDKVTINHHTVLAKTHKKKFHSTDSCFYVMFYFRATNIDCMLPFCLLYTFPLFSILLFQFSI